MRSTFLIICSLLFAAVAIGAVYKWVDDEGNVHYGDTPPKDQEKETIEIAPAPPPKTIIEEQDRDRLPKAEEEVLRDGETDEVLEDEIEAAKQPVARYPTDIKCFTPLTEAWGGRIADTREGVTRQPFKNDEHKQLMTLFDALEGRWSGRIEDVTCHSPGADPPSKTHDYKFRLNARWQSEQRFWIEAELEGARDTRAVLRQFFWFLLSTDGLRFRKAKTDISFELDKPGNDVEILEVGDNILTFYWRRGGTIRRTNVFFINKNGRSFTISEYFYVQGVLAGKCLWKLGK